MKALIITRYNGPLEPVSLPKPVIGRDEVLVRIISCGLNALDTRIRAGRTPHTMHRLPLVLGIDMAGIVEGVGSNVTGFAEGDEVYGIAGGIGGTRGSLAEYAAVDMRLIALKPSNLSMKQAAALPLAFNTAYAGIVDRARLEAGQTVLVHGGAGSVGHIAAQLAVALRARVFATVDEKDMHAVQQIGVKPIEYRTSNVEDYVRTYTGGIGFDLVFDTVGGSTLDASFKAVAPFGHVVSTLGWQAHSLAALSFRDASYSGLFSLSSLLTGRRRKGGRSVLRIATALVEAGKLCPRLDPRQFNLTNVDLAYKAMLDGSVRGKLVVDIHC
jgi:NADPH2:quinone reductase